MQRKKFANRAHHVHISLLHTNNDITVSQMVSVQILLPSWGVVSGNLALTIILHRNYLFIHLFQFILLKKFSNTKEIWLYEN